jgi:hypothetical protein
MTQPDDASISELLALREKRMRATSLAETPDERMARFARLQQASFELLRSSAEGYRNYLKRNYASRSVEVVDGQWRPVSPTRRYGAT